jgi:hypothetical protein
MKGRALLVVVLLQDSLGVLQAFVDQALTVVVVMMVVIVQTWHPP